MSKKEVVHYVCAVGMIIFGCAMCLLSFIFSELHKVDDSVLWILGQSLLFAGSIFGVGLYVNSRVESTFLKYHQDSNIKKGGAENGVQQ